jgi:hypothetical protein
MGLGAATTVLPTVEVRDVAKQQLEKTAYHYGSTLQVYYTDQLGGKEAKKRHFMARELTGTLGIGSCTIHSIWHTLRFYHQA